MADDRLRDLERAARAGDRDAQARLLVELERLGTPVCKTPHRLMTPDEVEMAAALAGCRFAPGTFDKKFAHALGAQARAIAPWITSNQAIRLRIKVEMYRRQIPASVVALTKGRGPYALACGTCGRFDHAPRCPAHPVEAARREREQLGMFAPPEAAHG